MRHDPVSGALVGLPEEWRKVQCHVTCYCALAGHVTSRWQVLPDRGKGVGVQLAVKGQVRP